jgi:hypothetical protein
VKPAAKSNYVFIVLLLLDLTFMVLDYLFLRGMLGKRFSFENELGFAEFYQRAKELAILVTLLVLLWKTSDILYLSWVLLFAYVLIDDSFQVHETVGLFLSERLYFVSALGLRARDFGELLVTGSAALLLVLLLLLTYRRGQPDSKHFTRILLILLLLLALFGVVVDMVHIQFSGGGLGELLGTIEDGGELIVVSVTLWYVIKQTRKKNPASSL